MPANTTVEFGDADLIEQVRRAHPEALALVRVGLTHNLLETIDDIGQNFLLAAAARLLGPGDGDWETFAGDAHAYEQLEKFVGAVYALGIASGLLLRPEVFAA